MGKIIVQMGLQQEVVANFRRGAGLLRRPLVEGRQRSHAIPRRGSIACPLVTHNQLKLKAPGQGG